MKIKVHNLNIGDKFWYEGRQFEIIGKSHSINFKMPSVLAMEVGKDQSEQGFGDDFKGLKNIPIPFCTVCTVFTTKKESVDARIADLESRIKAQKIMVEKEQNMLDIYISELENFKSNVAHS